MMNERNNNIREKKELLSPQQLKSNLEKINGSFNNYINSLIQDFDENHECLQNSVQYSTELIDEFKKFYDHFNLLSEEILSNKANQNQPNNNNSNPSERKTIIMDNLCVKELGELIADRNNKLTKTNNENKEKIKKFNDELRELAGISKK